MDETDGKKTNTKIANERRKQTRQATIDRHANMRCFTRDLSINLNSKHKRGWVNRLFLESKWLYNDYLAQRKKNGKFKEHEKHHRSNQSRRTFRGSMDCQREQPSSSADFDSVEDEYEKCVFEL